MTIHQPTETIYYVAADGLIHEDMVTETRVIETIDVTSPMGSPPVDIAVSYKLSQLDQQTLIDGVGVFATVEELLEYLNDNVVYL